MKRPSMACLLGILLAASVLLAGCPGPTPPVVPTAAAPTLAAPGTAAPTFTATAAATPTETSIPSTPPPPGWVEQYNDILSLWLPARWEVVELGDADLQQVFAEFQSNNPSLAQMIGSAEALQGVVLWAFGPAADDASLAPNLNVRRVSLAGEPAQNIEDIVGPIVGQYRALGFTGISSAADLRIGDHPAAYITYGYPFTVDGATQRDLVGHQYLVLTDTDLWILSYASGPDDASTQAATFAQSAHSFRPK